MKIKNILLIFTCVTFMYACSDDFLSLTPYNRVTTENLFKKANDFNITIIGCYAKLQGQINFYEELSEYRSDNMYITAPTAGTQDRYDIDQFVETAANGILSGAWANYNNGVYRCNIVLDRIDDATFDQQLKNQYKGEALFLRALTYFNMYRIWGSVPTTRKTVTIAEALQIGRSSEQEMYDLIAGDLETIVNENLLPSSYNAANTGRATSGAAKTLLGKVYLTFREWEKARDILKDVIDNHSYTLQANPADVFDVNNKMNSEIVFAIRFNKNVDGEGHGFWHTAANPADAVNPSPQLLASYSNPGDKRKDLISYVQAETNLFVLKKFYDVRNATTTRVGNDFILLRYADVLLMYAEALNEIAFTNSITSPAYINLNAVNKRAGNSDIAISEIPDQTSFRRRIMIERQREFPYEGHRWYDLVRMGYAREVMAVVGHTLSDYQFLYPIPKTELERINNTDLLWQNTGYN
jgi:starch-binding outer membrane protein, SusD/RagB family